MCLFESRRSDSARSYVTSSHINDEVRTIVSQSNAGGGGRHELSSAQSHTGGGANQRGGLANALDAWPVDLRDLDESLESSLADPSTAGSLYIRLLVKTIGVLECEEDVERMVLDGVVDRFKESAIRNVRENAAAKLAKELARPARERGEDDDDLTVHTRLFTSFIGSLLDSSLLALRRMLYLLKLLYVSKAMRSEGPGYGAGLSAAHIDVEKHFKDHDKRQILTVYMGLEDLIVQQMLSHLVEPDVQDIMDSGTGQMQGLVSKYGSQNREGFMLLERGEDHGDGDGEVELIFAPSARHAAPIFRRIVVYTQLVNKVFKENALEEMRVQLLAAKVPPPTPNQKTEGTGNTAGRSLLDVIQTFLENELIPVIQSTVNAGMREIQLNNAHFSVMQDSISGASAAGGNNNNAVEGGIGSAKRGTGDAVPLCHAAHLCCAASKPLFSYWLQLHQHRSMVCTVLDRLIRGYASAAREELEALTYNCVTVTQENMQASLVQSTKLDPLYKAYRMKVFGPNKVTVDDLFATGATAITGAEGGKALARRSFMPNSSTGVGGAKRSALRGSNAHFALDGADLDDLKGRNALESTVWEQMDYWDVGNNNYPITAQKVRTTTTGDSSFDYLLFKSRCRLPLHRVWMFYWTAECKHAFYFLFITCYGACGRS